MDELNLVAHPSRNLAMELVRATEAAAIRAVPFIGKGDKLAADGAGGGRDAGVPVNGRVRRGRGDR